VDRFATYKKTVNGKIHGKGLPQPDYTKGSGWIASSKPRGYPDDLPQLHEV